MPPLIALAALATVGVAARHLYIQSLPPDSVPACGASLDFMLKVFPLPRCIVKVLTGSGECAKVNWRLFGLSMPGWVLIAAVCLGALGTLGQSAPPAAGAQVLMPDTLDLTCDLMSRPSVSPTDGGCQALMGERLRALGFEVENLRFGQVDNLWARRGAAGPLFCFAGHTDVVPPGPLEEWQQRSVRARGARRDAVRARRGGYEERARRHADWRARNSLRPSRAIAAASPS